VETIIITVHGDAHNLQQAVREWQKPRETPQSLGGRVNNKYAAVPDSLRAFHIYEPSVDTVLVKCKVKTTLREEYTTGLKIQTNSSGKNL
jgi:hypothetical protein